MGRPRQGCILWRREDICYACRELLGSTTTQLRSKQRLGSKVDLGKESSRVTSSRIPTAERFWPEIAPDRAYSVYTTKGERALHSSDGRINHHIISLGGYWMAIYKIEASCLSTWRWKSDDLTREWGDEHMR